MRDCQSFRYIAIETDGAVDVGNTNHMDDYEQINLVAASVDSFAPTQDKLNPESSKLRSTFSGLAQPGTLEICRCF